MNNKRVENIIKNMNNKGIKQLIITSPSSIYYILGVWIEPGERLMALYINSNGTIKFFANELFALDSNLGVDLVLHKDGDDSIEPIASICEDNTVFGVDKTWPSHFLITLMEKKPNLKFVNASPVIDEVRMIKDENEIGLLKEASIVNDKVMKDLINSLSKEKSEKTVADNMMSLYKKYGTEEFSFPPIVAYGANAASPHHDCDSTFLKKGDCIILDIGGKTKGYCSDMTRTVFYGEPSLESRKVYNTVLESNLAGIKAIKPGVKLCDIDKASRDVIDNAGYGKYYTHRTGHNIGIEDHEYPSVGSTDEEIAKPGMVFSIEPGIYIPGKVGVRIEDLVLVTETGCKVLNAYPKELKIIE
ncbi:M24 family metallopeptidase [Haloimpatiens sp. FM7315]|uniref:M24 family metallopeptidase n=1 Tax=Haloimpatiens sp. FM7315 TaxID=3298609 RepID=UPI00370C0C19